MKSKLRWGLLATGGIARKFAQGLAESKTGELVAIGSRTAAAAEKFSGEFPARPHGSYEALLADPEVEAVYISTPHPMHAEWTIKAAEAGKHVLCEKPLAMNHAEAMAVIEAARANDVFLMEAFMYRCQAQTTRIVELVQAQVIGEVRLVQASFSFRAEMNLERRLLSPALGGGGILDVGCYPVSMARLIAGAISGRPFLNPVTLTGTGVIGAESGVDEYAIASLEFENGMLAQLASGVRLRLENNVRIWGTEGHIVIPTPWAILSQNGESKILVHKTGVDEPEEILLQADRGIYATEADNTAEHIAARQSPAMSWADSLGNLRTLDRWREAIGLVYPSEKPEAQRPVLVARARGRRVDAPMPCGRITGLDRRISRLIMGCDNQRTYPHAAVMFDDFLARGGNAFDTAYLYSGGMQERLLGHWIRNRGVRDEIVVIGKGGHTPYCTPDGVSAQLKETLQRLQLDHVDLYLLHRDNPDVPVGEFITVLNEHAAAGRLTLFGASNWSSARVQAANDYAAAHGQAGFAVVSNNFSLARMVDPVWRDCIASSDPAMRAWHEQTQMPLLAWSSQARGFFTERAGRDQRADAELVRCWYSDDNFQRRERAIDLANQKGVLPINIALAYVLTQGFPTFALIGPRLIEETRTTMPALEVSLTAEEARWLDEGP